MYHNQTGIIIIVIFLAHQHKAAARKTRLDIQNYGCNGNLLCYQFTMVLWKETAFSLCSAMERHWKRMLSPGYLL